MQANEGLAVPAARDRGARHVLTGRARRPRVIAMAIVPDQAAPRAAWPGSLVEQWRVAQACVAADVSIIMQASTGLTGGSTPTGDGYPGGCVIISTTRINGLHLIRNGAQVVCLPGTTLYALEKALALLGREPHSVIGPPASARRCGGAQMALGGSLVQRAAYTQLSLYGQIGGRGVAAGQSSGRGAGR